MKTPDQCPLCHRPVSLPEDRKFQSIECPECNSPLWLAYRKEGIYFFDREDEDLYRHYRGLFRAADDAAFANNGWVCLRSAPGTSLYERLVETRQFDIRKRPMMQFPGSTAEIDFSEINCKFPVCTPEEEAVESRLRTITMQAFAKCAAGELCFAIDVNHAEYSFLPSSVDANLDSGWPIRFSPFSEYLLLSTRRFEQGVLVDPRNRHVTAFGDSFVTLFANEFSELVVS